MAAAIWRSRFLDSLLSGFIAVGMATPSFVSGILLIVVFGVKFDLLPTQGYVPFADDPVESLKTVLLPAITLAIAIAAPLMLILRASLDDVASAPYIRTARAKGLLKPEGRAAAPAAERDHPGADDGRRHHRLAARRDRDRRVRLRASRASAR